MYADYVKEAQFEKAEKLKNSYDFVTGIKISDSISIISSFRYVDGIGTVLDDGEFIVVYGNVSAHIKDLGWQTIPFQAMNSSYASDVLVNTAPTMGQFLGTYGQYRCLEAYTLPRILYRNYNYDSDIMDFQYQAHIQSIGWQALKYTQSISGTSGQSLRVEAIRIYLTPDIVTVTPTKGGVQCLCQYTTKLYYRSRLQDIGWASWVGEGQISGTTGQGRRLEGMQIRVYLVE